MSSKHDKRIFEQKVWISERTAKKKHQMNFRRQISDEPKG